MTPSPADSPTADASLPALTYGRRRWLLAGLLLNHLLQAALAVAVAWQLPAQMRQLSLPVGQGMASANEWAGAALIGTVLVALGGLRHLSLVQAEALAQHYIAHVRLRLFDRLASLSPAGQQRRSRGGLMLRFVGDVQALRAWVGTGIAQCVAAACALVALVGGLAWWTPSLALLAVAWCGVAAAAMGLSLPRLAQAVRDSRSRQARIAANIHDRISRLHQMQVTGSASRERRRLGQQNRRLRRALIGRAWAQALHRSALDLCILGLGVSLVAAALLGVDRWHGPWADALGSHDPATSLWVGVMGLLGLLSTPLRGIGLALESRAAAKVARERMLDFLAEPLRLRWAAAPRGPQSTPQASRGRPRPGGPKPHEPTATGRSSRIEVPDIRLDRAGVTGRLPPLSATLPSGTRLALLGEPGSGKSTLLALLTRLEDPTQGQVLAAERPLPRWPQADWRRLVSHLSAETTITRGNLRQFLRLRHPSAADRDLLRACAQAGWTQATLSDLNQRLHEEGAGLTGQRRRQVALAASLVGSPGVLVIDDAEHALPWPAAAHLARLLAEFPGTLVYATTQSALAAMAPHCWTFESGGVAVACREANGVHEPCWVGRDGAPAWPKLHLVST